jgi:dUTP pyrophosphatase
MFSRVKNFFKVLFNCNDDDLYLTKVKVVNKSRHNLPEYETLGAAGMDLKANISEPITLHPMERFLVPTGIHIQLPEGFEAQIRPRSGLAAKYGITVTNAPGTIDSDYTGEIKVSLINLSSDNFVIHPGERVAQMVIAKYDRIEWFEVSTLDKTERGDGGFGSTGMN